MRSHRLRRNGGHGDRPLRKHSRRDRRYVRYVDEVQPDPEMGARPTRRMQPVFDKLYANSQALYDDLDRLARQSR